MRFSIRAILCVAAIVAMLFAAARHCLGPIMPESVVQRIIIGMPKSEVRAILGVPKPSSTRGDWTYERFMNPGWLIVHFDANDNVESIDHEIAFQLRTRTVTPLVN